MPETARPRHPSGGRGHRLVHWLLLKLENRDSYVDWINAAYFFLRFAFLAFAFLAGAFLAFFFFAVIGMSNDSSNVCSGPANRIPQNTNNMSGLCAILQYYPAFRTGCGSADARLTRIFITLKSSVSVRTYFCRIRLRRTKNPANARITPRRAKRVALSGSHSPLADSLFHRSASSPDRQTTQRVSVSLSLPRPCRDWRR